MLIFLKILNWLNSFIKNKKDYESKEKLTNQELSIGSWLTIPHVSIVEILDQLVLNASH